MAGPNQVIQKFDITPASGTSGGQIDTQHLSWNVPPEVFLAFDKLTNPDIVFVNKLSRLLFKAELVKTDMTNDLSPISGHSLVGIGKAIDAKNLYEDRGQLVNWDGYNTIVGNYAFLTSEAISTSDFDEATLDLKQINIDSVWEIIVQIVANWEDWEWKDPYEIQPLGLAMWFNLHAVTKRSVGGKGLSFITSIFKYMSPQKERVEERRDAIKFWKPNTDTRT